MQYFDQSADKYERAGKVIGDLFAATLMIALIIIFSYSLSHR